MAFFVFLATTTPARIVSIQLLIHVHFSIILGAAHFLVLEPVGEFRRRPESEQFFRLAKTVKQAMLVLSSIQPDAARRTTAAALIRQ